MNLAASFKKIPQISSIVSIAKKNKINIWLVGGFLRDVYLKKTKDLCDFDFCVEKNTLLFVKEFSLRIASKFIVLDKKQESYRVIYKKGFKFYTYDFTVMRGDNLMEDLALRDFSINTLAVGLKNKKIKLIDNFSARKDLRLKVIRVVKKEVIAHDPLRILRAFSFMANYGFRIKGNTLKLLAESKGLIRSVSPERINEELFKIFSSPFSFKIINAMDKISLINEIIPQTSYMRGISQGAYHHLDVWKHSLETLKQFELLYNKRLATNKDILFYLNEELAQGRRRSQIIKLACILHDIGKPAAKKKLKKKTIFHAHEKIGRDMAAQISQDLRLSFRESEVLKKLIFWHLRPGYLADQVNPSKRAIYRFFRDTQTEGAATIILSLSDWRATRGPLTDAKKRRRHEKIMIDLINLNFFEQKKKPLPKLIDGHIVMKKFGLKSGPLVGIILENIKEAQALGNILTKKEACSLARATIKKVNKIAK